MADRVSKYPQFELTEVTSKHHSPQLISPTYYSFWCQKIISFSITCLLLNVFCVLKVNYPAPRIIKRLTQGAVQLYVRGVALGKSRRLKQTPLHYPRFEHFGGLQDALTTHSFFLSTQPHHAAVLDGYKFLILIDCRLFGLIFCLNSKKHPRVSLFITT